MHFQAETIMCTISFIALLKVRYGRLISRVIRACRSADPNDHESRDRMENDIAFLNIDMQHA